MSSLNDKEILVVDDAADFRLMARKILETDGAKVVCAESVAEALDVLTKAPPQLILLDLNFPQSSGFQFLTERLASSTWKNIPTIVLSGLRDRDSVMRAISLGANDYVLKPFRASILLQKVRKSLMLATFQTFRFQEDQRPMLQGKVGAELRKASEVGFRLECPVKLDVDAIVDIESELLNALGAKGVITKTSNRPGTYSGTGRHTFEILFSGVGEEFTKSIRRALKRPA